MVVGSAEEASRMQVPDIGQMLWSTEATVCSCKSMKISCDCVVSDVILRVIDHFCSAITGQRIRTDVIFASNAKDAKPPGGRFLLYARESRIIDVFKQSVDNYSNERLVIGAHD